MQLRPAPLLLLGAALGVFVPGGCCGSPSHFLRYYYLEVSEPSQGLPQFLIRGCLDDQPIILYNSLIGRVEPLVPWMEKAEKETFLSLGWVFRTDLEKSSKLNHSTKGLHTWQAILGCELREDGGKRGFLHYGYNGKDFIRFEKETFRWVAAQPQAKKVKEKWEEDLWWSEKMKVYLEKTCIEWLQIYLSYQKEVLQRIEPPVGKVTHKVVDDDSLEILICQAFGFYPKEIQVTWTRGREVQKNESLHRNVTSNSDGTYYVQLSIEIDPKERGRFRCHLKHEALQEPLVLAPKDKTERRIPVGAVVGVIFGAVIFFLMYNKIQSEPMLQFEVTSEDKESYGERSPQRVLENSGSTLRRREGKKKPQRKSKTWTGKMLTLEEEEAIASKEGSKAEKVTERSVRRKRHTVPIQYP